MEGNGSGVIGDLSKPIMFDELLQMLQEKFHVSVIRHNRCIEKQIKRIAICGGAGSFLINDALNLGADAFITGEIGYHHFFGFDNIMSLIEIGHYESEQFTIELLYDILLSSFPSLPLFMTKINTNPIEYFCNNNRR
jgi:putative NIF3 family GTP cyclohydrolase 1 type 2